jgi:hypothetical protein
MSYKSLNGKIEIQYELAAESLSLLLLTRG